MYVCFICRTLSSKHRRMATNGKSQRSAMHASTKTRSYNYCVPQNVAIRLLCRSLHSLNVCAKRRCVALRRRKYYVLPQSTYNVRTVGFVCYLHKFRLFMTDSVKTRRGARCSYCLSNASSAFICHLKRLPRCFDRVVVRYVCTSI